MSSVTEMLQNLIPKRWRKDVPVVPVVRLTGPIGLPGPFVVSMSLESVAPQLERAFKIKHAKGVALIVNSPGGSAVQSHLIHRRIRALAEEHKKHVFVFIEDVAASGGYMIATAGDTIVADGSSIVGSIGVISAGFGFDKAIEKLGVDRRVYTAGDRKAMLDGFQPEKPEDVRRLKTLQKEIHRLFIDLVKSRRDGELDGSDRTLFSGEFWVGRKALDLGLVDQIGDLRSVMRERYGEKVQLVPIAPRRGYFSRPRPAVDGLTNAGSDGIAVGWGAGVIAAIEARLMWSRFGL